MDKRPIGIFDSGVGGLTVVKEVMELLPNENTVYFGDTARVPYGSKSTETVNKFSSQIIRFLKTKGVKAIIIACNTVSSNCFHQLQEEFNDLKIIEVVSAGVVSCINTTKNNIVGVIGTDATIRSMSYEKRIKSFVHNIQVYSKSCPLFVPLAEEGWVNNEVSKLTAKAYLEELKNFNIDSLILGCTHYPLLIDSINYVFDGNINIVNPARETAMTMKRYLTENNIINNQKKGQHQFYVSDNYLKFDDICYRVLEETYKSLKIDIEKY